MEGINQSTCIIEQNVAYGILIAVYSFGLIGGLIGTALMFMFLCRTNTRSMTTTAVINLLIVHSIFLSTVPFRIAYYIQRKWLFELLFCRFVSAMVHIHMYLCFIFYTIMLVIRFLCYFRDKDKLEFYRKLHSVVASTVVWVITLGIITPVFFTHYGTHGTYEKYNCFNFHIEIQIKSVAVLNYLITAVVFIVICILFGVQIFIMVKVAKKLQGSIFSHQEFRAQLKSLFFILIMITCFFPYHLLRIYYIKNPKDCFFYNEICLGITALSCNDLLVFSMNNLCSKWCTNMTCKLNCLYK